MRASSASDVGAGAAGGGGRVHLGGWWLPALFLLALAVRCVAVTLYPAVPANDAADYHRLAADLSRGLGYVNVEGGPTAWRPPGYPAFLAGVYSVFGMSVTAATLVQAALGGLTVVLLAVFGALVVGRREGLAAGLLAAVYPGLFWVPRVLMSENLSLPLTLGVLCAAAMLLRTGRLRWAGACGLLLGVSALVRGANLQLVPLLLAGMAFFAWRRRQDWRRLAAASALVCALVALTLLPWTLRNYGVFQRFVPVATQGGMTLYSSYWPPVKDGKRIWGNLQTDEDPEWVAAKRLGDEAAASQYLEGLTFKRLRANPSYFFALIPPKMLSLAVPLDWELFPHAAGASRSLNPVYALTCLVAVVGLLMLRRRRAPHAWLLWVLPVSVLVQTVTFYGSPRFRLPAETSAILWASVALILAWERFGRRAVSPAAGRREEVF